MVVGSYEFAVLGLSDLLKNKRAVGRSIDQEDIIALEQKRKKLGED